ncbi:MAG: RluA family pseudouridine synthase [Nitrospinaceae bacterium]
MKRLKFKVDRHTSQKRLDVFLSESQEDISRSQLKRLIEKGQVMVNGFPGRTCYKVKPGDCIELHIPDPTPLELPREAIPLNIVFEDDCLVVVDKPAGMVVHPAPGHSSGTLVNALLHHCFGLSGIGGVERPGIVHRLDKETSGLVLIAKTESAHKSLSLQFKRREIKKVYLALVRGRVESNAGIIQAPIGRHKIHRKKMTSNIKGGREATTEFQVLKRYDHFTYLQIFPKTGRTHQIRVHLASIGHPVLGDKLYGGKTGPKPMKMTRHALHAHRLEIRHPLTGKWRIFESPLPPDMEDYLKSNNTL